MRTERAEKKQLKVLTLSDGENLILIKKRKVSNMILTKEQQAILDGEKGETMAKVMKTLVMYGDAFGAERMVPVTSKYNHLVTSFGLKMMTPVFDLMQQLIDAGVVSEQKFSVDPRPIDKNVPANPLQKLIFNKFMYSK